MGKSFPKRFCIVFCLVSAIAYLPFLVGIPSNGVFTSMERVWHDLSFTLRGDAVKGGDERLILLAVDDETVRKHGFPLPRIAYARGLDKLRGYGVKTVIFDVMFLEKREGDAELAAATKRHGNVVHLYLAEPGSTEDAPPKVQLTAPAIRAVTRLFACPFITDHLDDDGHIRTFTLFSRALLDPLTPELGITSMAAASLAGYWGRPLEEVAALEEEGIPSVLNYRKPKEWPRHEAAPVEGDIVYSPYRTISLMDLLSGRLTQAQKKSLKDAIVMVGSTSTGYYDHYPTPFTSHAPGAEYHLNIIDNILNGDALSATSRLWVLLLVILSAWIPYFLLHFLPPAAGAAMVAAMLAGMGFGSLQLMNGGTVLYPVAPGLTLILSFIILTVHKVLTEGAEKQLIKAKFGQFVSPEIVEELANDPEKAKLGAQKREMTVLFLDIAHFTTISEKMGPEALMEFLNRYLSALSSVMLDRRGTIDKYIGDCIMAFWNAPLENKAHARDAVLSALQCQEAIAELNKNLDPGLPETPAIRIGINTGQMNVGFTGTERKLAYPVIGDEVNLASRL
ncbi:MAG: adenylate/guanylate cyclase domain-containing protein, partial [Elusimicrobia bacterium]|nr:adenylate/guanylate cyclase domain-containing protein [Elusimicrobiota bacterium]